MSKIKTVHIANGRRPLCGASSHMTPEISQAYSNVPHNVNCLRCIKCFDAATDRIRKANLEK